MEDELITVEEAAAIIGVSKAQANRYCINGLLPSVPGGKRGRGYARKVRRADAQTFQRPKHGPKRHLLAVTALALGLLLLPQAVLAQDVIPPADPGDLVGVIEWLASGIGVGFVLSILATKSAWYQQLASKVKFVVMTCICGGLPVLATALLQLVPADVWVLLQPYWRAFISGIFVLAGSQVYYQTFVKGKTDGHATAKA